jgi:hypothetical protein
MKFAAGLLVQTILVCVNATVALAADSIDALSALPIVPNSTKLADPVQSYKYCGKNAQMNVYMYGGMQHNDNEDLVATAKAWYLKVIPHANVFSSSSGQVTVITADGTSAVILSGSVINFAHFSPGLTLVEMKLLGDAPASRECHAD